MADGLWVEPTLAGHRDELVNEMRERIAAMQRNIEDKTKQIETIQRQVLECEEHLAAHKALLAAVEAING